MTHTNVRALAFRDILLGMHSSDAFDSIAMMDMICLTPMANKNTVLIKTDGHTASRRLLCINSSPHASTFRSGFQAS